jgi:aminoglycoside/choline kinase family phosphotransferase
MPLLRFEEVSPVLAAFLARYGFDSRCEISLAGLAGSRRAYHRMKSDGRSFILLVSPPDDADFGRFLRITQFYRMARFPVPQAFCIDDAARQVLLEDLGDRRLYDVLRADRAAGLDGYRQALDLLVDLQTRCQALHAECPDIESRVFDREHLLWETSYYRAQYLEGHRGLRPDAALQNIFDELATLVDQHPKAILHRDFQSQNLMVAGGAVHVIDYQGSRQGSIYYDLASLLLDPYVMLSDSEIDGLLRYFHVKSLSHLDYSGFRAAFLQAGLQRVMQALGAYCFLSRVRGIAAFAEHIPAGEKRLKGLLRAAGKREWELIIP